MTPSIQRLDLTPVELRTTRRINAGLALMPRMTIDEARLETGQKWNARLGQTAERVTGAWLKRQGVRIETERLPGPDGPVTLRILNPPQPPRGVVLDIHGGGWIVGSAGLNDRLNAHLVTEAGFAVVSVDYRLLSIVRDVQIADAVSDCTMAVRWLAEQAKARFGTDRLFLLGESAGAHLGALATLAARDQGLRPFLGCIFVYGVFDLSGTPSVRAAGPQTLLLNGPTLAADMGRLLPDRDEAGRRRPDVSPLYAALEGVPPGLFVIGDLDPLRDDSVLMAHAWAQAAAAEVIEAPESPHGFLHFTAPAAAKARTGIRTWMETRLSTLG